MAYKINPFTGEFDLTKSAAPSGYGSFSQIVVNKIAGETIPAIKAVYCSSSSEVLLSDNLVFGKQSVIGISKTAGLLSQSIEIVTDGILEDSSFSGFTINEPIFVGLFGSLTQTVNSFGVLLEVGYYLGQNKIEIEIKRPIILA